MKFTSAFETTGLVWGLVLTSISMPAGAQQADTDSPEEVVVEEEIPTNEQAQPDTATDSPVETAPVESGPEPPAPPPAPVASPTAPPPVSQVEDEPRALPAAPEEAAEEDEEEQALGWFSLSPQVGYTFFPEAKMSYQGFTTTVSPRNGLIAKLHLDLGGDGFGFELAPLFGFQSGGIDNSGGELGNLSTIDPAMASFLNLGGEAAIVYRFRLGYFYPHLGVGVHGSYVFGQDIEYGVQIYGRVPFGFSLYLGKAIALVVEGAVLFGATGIKQPFAGAIDAQYLESLGLDVSAAQSLAEALKDATAQQAQAVLESNEFQQAIEDLQRQGYTQDQLKTDLASHALGKVVRFGTGIGLELSIGIRFP
jgi:hypothetical protein